MAAGAGVGDVVGRGSGVWLGGGHFLKGVCFSYWCLFGWSFRLILKWWDVEMEARNAIDSFGGEWIRSVEGEGRIYRE